MKCILHVYLLFYNSCYCEKLETVRSVYIIIKKSEEQSNI